LRNIFGSIENYLFKKEILLVCPFSLFSKKTLIMKPTFFLIKPFYAEYVNDSIFDSIFEIILNK